MATPPFTIANVPADDDFASQFPAAERTFRDTVNSWLQVDHNTSGEHKQATFPDVTSHPTFASGKVGLYNIGGVLYTRVAGGAVERVDHFTPGVRVPFYQAAPPLGWTLDATVNDQVLRVVNTSGGGTGGSWTISGLVVGGHALTVTEIPPHSHGTDTQPGTIREGNFSDKSVTVPGVGVTGNAGNGGGHVHPLTADGAWRPAYINVVIGVKT